MSLQSTNTTTISNLSFVIIAHNEEFALQKCLESVSKLQTKNCEVFCIDSNSTDNTYNIAKTFKDKIANFNLIKLTGYQNASIARNAGLQLVTKKNIFFIDGDVELNEKFIQNGIAILNGNIADAVFGSLDDYEYSLGYNDLLSIRQNRASIKQEENRYLCGGIFMITKETANSVGLFDEELTRCEDFDYTLRLTRNHLLKVIPISMGNHHTIPYSNTSRMKNELKNNLPLFYGTLLRKNLSNKLGCIAHVRRAGYVKGLIVLLLLTISVIHHLFLLPALSLIFIDIILGVLKKQDIKYRMFSHYIVPLYVLYGFIFNSDITKKTVTKK